MLYAMRTMARVRKRRKIYARSRACGKHRAHNVSVSRSYTAASGALLTQACLHKFDLGSGHLRRRRRRPPHISTRPQVGIPRMHARFTHRVPFAKYMPKSESENLFPLGSTQVCVYLTRVICGVRELSTAEDTRKAGRRENWTTTTTMGTTF